MSTKQEWNSAGKFAQVASQWDEHPLRRTIAQQVADAIIEQVQPTRQMRALEFGCGTGLVSMAIAPLVGHLVALDTSAEMLEVLQEKISAQHLSGIETHTGKLESYDGQENVAPEGFELIYASMTLHHIHDTAAFLQHAVGRLAPGGILALADLDLEDGTFHPDPDEEVHPGFDRDALTRLLEAAGLEQVRFTTVYTVEKPAATGGGMASYSIFLVTAINPARR